MSALRKSALAAIIVSTLSLTACGHTYGERALSGRRHWRGRGRFGVRGSGWRSHNGWRDRRGRGRGNRRRHEIGRVSGL